VGFSVLVPRSGAASSHRSKRFQGAWWRVIVWVSLREWLLPILLPGTAP
jgi:hypothetical protein